MGTVISTLYSLKKLHILEPDCLSSYYKIFLGTPLMSNVTGVIPLSHSGRRGESSFGDDGSRLDFGGSNTPTPSPKCSLTLSVKLR